MKPKVIFKKDDLERFLHTDSLVSTILNDIVFDYKVLDNQFDLIGIASNVLLGVFGLKYNGEEGYSCYRIYYEKEKLIAATKGYPVTNMGGSFDIDCEMDYVISIKTIQNLGNQCIKDAI